MDFASGLPLMPSRKDSVWVIVDRLTKPAHFIPVCTDYSLQKLAKLYVSEIVSPWKKVLRLGRKGKLSPRFIGSYHILKRVGLVAYQLELPPELDRIHNMFHVSMLRRFHSNPTHIISTKKIEVRPDLTFGEEPVQILDCDIKVLRRKSVPLVKVLWCSDSSEEARWVPEEAMHSNAPICFDQRRIKGENWRTFVVADGGATMTAATKEKWWGGGGAMALYGG
ncbi:uncharacterized protein [Gossypium hirsutum]|uniref:Tf2-1-like SH3-like domain-containing protein n=1 Tax=Gossypium hirsutum TaxID=3635 RepID=A0A1U8HVZ1_GOSHI|nr:uncharacterized protein LOC107887791 [Gossypium hirsutum]